MSLFKPAANEQAFLKMGIMGFAAAGKTVTACKTAIGLVQLCRDRKLPYADKPVFFLDTEGGADYVRGEFDEAGIELMVARTRAFKDLIAAIDEAEKAGSVLIIDSITHFWEEWCEAYKEAKNRKRGLEFSDWSYLKGQWRKGFTDKFLNSRLHIILCGRAGYEYEHYVDDAGKKQIEKSGIKMKAEGEMGYEPSLLVLMEREMDMDQKTIHRSAHILKDRFQSLDGKTIPNPTFKSFLPHIIKLNLGGEQAKIDTSRTSADMIPDDPKREDNAIRRQIVIDEIDALLAEHGLGGTSAEVKQRRAELVKKHFATVSRTEIEKLMPLVDLQANYDSLHRDLTGKASRYGIKPAAPDTPDEIPFLKDEAPPATAAQAPAKSEPPPATEAKPSPDVIDQALAAVKAVADEPEGEPEADPILEQIAETLAKVKTPAKLATVWKGIAPLLEGEPHRSAAARTLYAEAQARLGIRQAAE